MILGGKLIGTICNHQVGGSNPFTGSIFKCGILIGFRGYKAV